MDTTKEGVSVLLKLGIRTDLRGFKYIVDIFKLSEKYNYHVNGEMMELYRQVAVLNNTTYMNVESRIRSAIEIAFEKGNTEELYKLFANTIDEDKAKPTNQQFITTILWMIK